MGFVAALAARALRGLAKKKTKRSPPPVSMMTADDRAAAYDDDWRVRIVVPKKSMYQFEDEFEVLEEKDSAGRVKKVTTNFKQNIIRPLLDSNGVVFPYTPTITVTHSAEYSSVAPTHSNHPSYFYNSSKVGDISINAEFTAATEAEGEYLLAAIYFFRAATKMFYGQGANPGNPPPVLYLEGYGPTYLPRVPVVVTSFSHTMPADVDYINVQVTPDKTVETRKYMPTYEEKDKEEKAKAEADPNYRPSMNLFAAAAPFNQTGQTAKGATPVESNRGDVKNYTSEKEVIPGKVERVPILSTINLTLMPIYSRRTMAEKFSWDEFSHGRLLKDDGGFL